MADTAEVVLHDDQPVDRQSSAPAPPRPMEMDVGSSASSRRNKPLHCIIAGSFDIVGDHSASPCSFPGAYPYCALCGSTAGASPEHYYAVCGGCNVVDPVQCQVPRRPVLEIPCPLVCVLWPAFYPLLLVASHLTCGRAVHAGPCLLDCPCAGPTYRREEWFEEEPACACVNCCGQGYSCQKHS